MVQVKAVIFGAIGVIAETSDLQRRSFNLAFEEQGLDWNWDTARYRELLSINGGQERLRAYRDADPQRQDISDAMIATLHERKTHHYAGLTRDGGLKPRRGVVELIDACRLAGVRIALCTSTSADNVQAIADALGKQLDFGVFASITTIDKIASVKPAPDAYLHCLSQLGLSAGDVVAIEDTPVSMAAARSSGIAVLATPGAMTDDQDFSAASLIVTDLATITLDQINAVLERSLARPLHA